MSKDEGNMLWRQKDLYVSAAMLVSAGGVRYGASQIRAAESRTLPNTLFILMAVCGIGLLVRTLACMKRGAVRGGRLRFCGKELLGILCMGVCWLLMPVLGFYMSLCLLVMALTLLMESGERPTGKSLVRALAVGVVTMLLLYICFAQLFHIVTPTGIGF